MKNAFSISIVTFQWKIVFRKLSVFQTLFCHWPKNLWSFRKFLDELETNAFWQKLVYFWEIYEFLSLSELERIFFRNLSRTYRRVCENCNLRVQKIALRRKEIFWKVLIFFLSFLYFEQMTFRHLSRFFGRVLKTAF